MECAFLWYRVPAFPSFFVQAELIGVKLCKVVNNIFELNGVEYDQSGRVCPRAEALETHSFPG